MLATFVSILLFILLPSSSAIDLLQKDLIAKNDTKYPLIKTPLTNFKDEGYYMTFRVGHMSQNHLFTMLIDISNPSTWVPSKDCSNCYHSNKAESSYDCTSNPLTCFQNKTEDPTEIKYHLNSVVSYRGYDNISFQGVGNTNSFNQTLYFATQISENLYNINADGVFGLGLDSGNRSVSIVNTLYQLGWIKKPVFSLYLTDDISDIDTKSRIVFGGHDPKYLKKGEEFQMVPVALPDSWSVALKGASIAGKDLGMSPVIANLSNNFPYIGMPTEDFKGIMDKMAESNISCKMFDKFVTPLCKCNDENLLKFPNLVLELENNVKLNITQEDYLAYLYDLRNNHDEYGPKSYNCIVKLQDITPANRINFTRSWVFGGIVMNKYYTLFDQENMMIGFGVAQPSENNSDKRWSSELMMLCVLGVGFMVLAVGCFISKVIKVKNNMKNKNNNKKVSFVANQYYSL